MARHLMAGPCDLPWNLGTLFSRSPTREQRLLEALAWHADPRVAAWARANRAWVHDSEDLLRALERLQAEGDPLARTLAATVWLAWRNQGPGSGSAT